MWLVIALIKISMFSQLAYAANPLTVKEFQQLRQELASKNFKTAEKAKEAIRTASIQNQIPPHYVMGIVENLTSSRANSESRDIDLKTLLEIYQYPEAFTDRMLDYLQDRNPQIRLIATKLLKHQGTMRPLEWSSRLAPGQTDDELRIKHHSRVVSYLMKRAEEDSDSQVRREAIEAMQPFNLAIVFRGKERVDLITKEGREKLSEIIMNDRVWDVRTEAARLLVNPVRFREANPKIEENLVKALKQQYVLDHRELLESILKVLQETTHIRPLKGSTLFSLVKLAVNNQTVYSYHPLLEFFGRYAHSNSSTRDSFAQALESSETYYFLLRAIVAGNERDLNAAVSILNSLGVRNSLIKGQMERALFKRLSSQPQVSSMVAARITEVLGRLRPSYKGKILQFFIDSEKKDKGNFYYSDVIARMFNELALNTRDASKAYDYIVKHPAQEVRLGDQTDRNLMRLLRAHGLRDNKSDGPVTASELSQLTWARSADSVTGLFRRMRARCAGGYQALAEKINPNYLMGFGR